MRVVSSHYPLVKLDDLATIRLLIEETMIDFGADEDVVGELVLAVNEAVTNIIVHGYKERPGSVRIELERRDEDIVIRLTDQAPPFDPTKMPAVDISIPLDQREYGGMGVHMMREFTDELHYRATPTGENELTFVKRMTS